MSFIDSIEFIATQSILFYILWLTTAFVICPVIHRVFGRIIGYSTMLTPLVSLVIFPVCLYVGWFMFNAWGMSLPDMFTVLVNGSSL